MTIEWKLEKRILKDLKLHPKNPRQLSKDQRRHLASSLDRFGLVEKIIINQDNMIIGGHQRYRILKEKGERDVECWVPNRLLNSHEVDELCIRLNRNQGSFDYDILANEFDVADLMDWGFSEADITHDFLPEEKEEKKKKKKSSVCPSCGHEF